MFRNTISKGSFSAFFTLLFLFSFNLFSVEYILYGTVGEGSQGVPDTDLVIINQSTGAIEEIIGNIGYRINGLAYDPTTDNLYGTTSTNDPNFPNGLLLIDRETAQATPIGAGGWPDPIVCLTINSAGRLYAWYEPSDDDLAEIDKNTGTYSLFPNSGLNTWELSLDFNESGVLYLLNDSRDIYNISLLDGSATSVGSYAPYPYDAAHHGKFNPATWEMWAITEWGNTNPRSIAIIDVNTGNLINTLLTGDNLHTLAFVPLPEDKPLNEFSITGKKRKSDFLVETDYLNIIEWTFGPGQVGGFNVYRKKGSENILIAKLPETTRKYTDHNRKKKEVDEYTVKVIGLDGSVIESLSTQVGP